MKKPASPTKPAILLPRERAPSAELRTLLVQRMMAMMLKAIKLQVGRAQLATALDLFVRDKDPISVQCLACGGGEVIEGVARLESVEPLSTHVLREHPHLNLGELRRIRNQYWNAFKHLTSHSGELRNDHELLQKFNDTMNDSPLFVGWTDYHALTGTMPVAVQVFQVWWYALNEANLGANADFAAIRFVFPNLTATDRAEQKRRLRRTIAKWRTDPDLLADTRTRPIVGDRPPSLEAPGRCQQLAHCYRSGPWRSPSALIQSAAFPNVARRQALCSLSVF